MTVSYPSGTVAFLFTDIEGSTRRWEQDSLAMRRALQRHNEVLQQAIIAHGGVHYKTVGDAFQAAFHTVSAALAAAVEAQRALAAEPWSETGPLRVRMALHVGEAEPADGDYLAPALNRLARLLGAGHGGQVLLTDAARQLTSGQLPPGVTSRSLGTHRLRDLLAAEEVWQLVVPGLPDTFPPLRSLEGHPTNLPAQPNELIGRDKELADLKQLFARSGVRMATLFGPGGTGKTRLALQTAANLIDDYPDGAFFVHLSDLVEPDLLLAETARVLGVRESGGQTVEEALVTYLADSTLFLVLDNLEQFRPISRAGRVIARLLAGCPDLRVLATSRSALRIQAEYAYALEPLAVPDLDHLPRVVDLEGVASVDLFLQRARAVRPGFALTPENARPIAEICARVDGLPLAVELAAARTRALAPAELARRLGERMDLLAGKGGDRPDRQQTLRATIDWSHDLLDPDEQALFRRLAVFSGWFGLDDAEAVAANPAPLDRDVLDGISDLLDQSLLRGGEERGEMRYRMLVLLREYGREKLRASGEYDAVAASHANWYQTFVESKRAELVGPHGRDVLTQVESVHADAVASLEWLLDQGRLAEAGQMASILAIYWEERSQFSEARQWLDRILARATDGSSVEHARLLDVAARLAIAQGDLLAARPLLDRALVMLDAATDARSKGEVLMHLGVVHHRQQDLDRARGYLDQALALLEPLGELNLLSIVANNSALVSWDAGNLDEAERLMTYSLDIKRRLGNRVSESIALTNLAVLAVDRNDRDRAEQYLRASLDIDREMGNRSGVADNLLNLAALAKERGEILPALELLGDSLGTYFELGDLASVALNFEALAGVLSRMKHASEGAMLLGAAERLRAELQYPLPASEQERLALTRGDLEAVLGVEPLVQGIEEGKLLDATAGVKLGLELVDRLAMASIETGSGGDAAEGARRSP